MENPVYSLSPSTRVCYELDAIANYYGGIRDGDDKKSPTYSIEQNSFVNNDDNNKGSDDNKGDDDNKDSDNEDDDNKDDDNKDDDDDDDDDDD